MATTTKTTKSALSNVDLIRRFVFEHQPVSGAEIAAYVTSEMASARDAETALTRYVLPVLQAQPYYAQASDERWTTVREQLPEYKVLLGVLREEKRLLYERDVKSRIAKKLGMKVISVVCDLSQAPELAKHDSFWGLKEWTVANDQAADILKGHPNGISEKDLLKQVCERFKLDPDKTVLHLAGDKQKRFVNDRKLWFLKSDYDKAKLPKAPTAAKIPVAKGGVDMLLEGNFVLAQAAKAEDAKASKERAAKSRLKKAQVREAQQVLEQREDLVPKEDLAARMSQALREAGVDEYAVKSFQRVERASREKGLSQKERDEIQEFLDGLVRQETVGVGPSEQSVLSAPLSTRKVLDVLKLKYLPYSRDRAMLPPEFYRLLVRVLKPNVNDSVLNPGAFDGLQAVELFGYLFEALDGAAWAMTDEGQELEIVQPDLTRYRLTTADKQLTDRASDKFTVTQVDLLEHFINYRYTGIEGDKTLARAARTITRLSGYDGAYIANRDFFSELPQVFGQDANEENEIPQRFDCVIGNFTFTQDANLAANYLDLALKLLNAQGRLAVFVTDDLLKLLKQHNLLAEFLGGMAVTHFIRLPLIEGRWRVVELHIQAHRTGDPPPLVYAEVEDLKAANTMYAQLQAGDSEHVRKLDQLAFAQLIG